VQRITAIDAVEYGISPGRDALLGSATAQARWGPFAEPCSCADGWALESLAPAGSFAAAAPSGCIAMCDPLPRPSMAAAGRRPARRVFGHVRAVASSRRRKPSPEG